MPDNVVKEFTTIAVLHDHIKFFFCFNDFVELNHVGMSDLLENLDFPSYSFDILLIMNFVLL